MGAVNYFGGGETNRPSPHARGATASASSWISELITGYGIESDITDFDPEEDGRLFGRVADEFHAAEREMAAEARNIANICGIPPMPNAYQ